MRYQVRQRVDHVLTQPHRRARRRVSGWTRLDVLGDEGVQRGGRPIGQDRHPGSPEPARLLNLNGHAYQRLLALGSSAAQSWLLAADVRLVHLHLHRAGQSVSTGAHQHRAKPMQHRPRGRVRADLQRPLQAQRGHAVLARGEQPAGLEPHRQRRPSAIEQRPRRHRRPPAAARALVPPIGHPPAAGLATARAHEALGPAEPVQIVEAVLVGPEPGPELPGRARITHTGPGPHLIHSPSA